MMMPFGIELYEVLAFLLQLGLAVAGAAALWGLILTLKDSSDRHGDECIIFDWLAEKMLIPLYLGLIIAGGAWFALGALLPVFAHEGIVLVPTLAERVAAFELTWPFFAAWFLLSPIGLFVRRFKPHEFHRRLGFFFGAQLALIAILISIPAWSGFDLRQTFFFTHNIHSILTLGTVLVLDFLFLISKSSLHLKQHIYPLFPLISKVILIGLAIEFIGVAFVFSEALVLSPKFFFMQTLIGILLINGMILAGPVTRRMITAVSSSDGKLAEHWQRIGEISGMISVTSWFTITLVDYFADLTLSFLQLIGIYALVLLLVITGHTLWTRVLHISIPRWYYAWHRGE